MDVLPFKKSKASLGVELEFQIVDLDSYGLVSRAKELMERVKASPFKNRIKPEITQCMIEINSLVHDKPSSLLADLLELKKFLLSEAKDLNIAFCGGGTHPFPKWEKQKIFPKLRFKNIAKKYRYLAKHATIFGQHIHVGCSNANDALYLTHALARYVPQFIAISASSPFTQRIDTGYYSTRCTILTAFPSSGIIPFISTWDKFSNYFYKMRNLGLISSMKDFYWDIRPKPEFGTVEIRVFDTPLSIQRAVTIAAFVQVLACYLLAEKPKLLSKDLYYLYNYNRFQACRFGYNGVFINPSNAKTCSIQEDLINTINKVKKYADHFGSNNFIADLLTDIINKRNDADILKENFQKFGSFTQVVRTQCDLWKQNY